MNPSCLIRPLATATALAITLGFLPTAQAQVAGLSPITPCINILQGPRYGSSCTFNTDCPGTLICFEAACVDPDYADAQAWRLTDRHQDSAPVDTGIDPHLLGAQSLIDDGGADEACGQDRRCRIERLTARNRARRHYHIARQEHATRHEVERILRRPESNLLRDVKPWSIAFQVHPQGIGMMGGRTFAGHLRAEASLVFHDRYVSYVPDDATAAALQSFHAARFGAAHLTYLPSQRWLSPLLSAGFSMGSGNFGSPEVRYHLISGAVGAEAQFEVGLMVRLAYRHGRVLYNQVRHGPGAYEADTRRGLREYMNNEGLRGIDFSLGWAF